MPNIMTPTTHNRFGALSLDSSASEKDVSGDVREVEAAPAAASVPLHQAKKAHKQNLVETIQSGLRDDEQEEPILVRVLQWNLLAPTLAEGQPVPFAAEHIKDNCHIPMQNWEGGFHRFRKAPELAPGEAKPKDNFAFRATNADLAWEKRKQMITASVARAWHSDGGADFLCFQEIEEDFFHELLVALSLGTSSGTTSSSAATGSESSYGRNMAEGLFFKKRGRYANDGCAILWKSSRWRLLKPLRRKLLEDQIMVALMGRFLYTGGGEIKAASNQEQQKRLQRQMGNKELIVCTTHMKAGFSAAMEGVRLKQAESLSKLILRRG